MFEVVREFASNGKRIEAGTIIDKKSFPSDHLDCAKRNQWVIPFVKKSPPIADSAAVDDSTKSDLI